MPDNAAALIVLTRPEAQARRFAGICRAEFGDRAAIVTEPLTEIVPVARIPALEGAAALVFTSENAVRVFADMSDRRDLRAYCVGDRTAEAAREVGLQALSAGGAADDLVALILADRPPGPVLHLRGAHARGAVAARLRAGGQEAGEAVIYDQAARVPSCGFASLAQGFSRVIVPLFSPRSASLFAAWAGDAGATARIVCLSPAVREALPAGWSGSITVSPAPNAPALLAEMARHISP